MAASVRSKQANRRIRLLLAVTCTLQVYLYVLNIVSNESWDRNMTAHLVTAFLPTAWSGREASFPVGKPGIVAYCGRRGGQIDPRTAKALEEGGVTPVMTSIRDDNGKVPDAFLYSADGQVQLAIEYGGLYSRSHLRGFHRACCRRRLPYELW